MADNRIYLRCSACGGELFLGKRFTESYYFDRYTNPQSLEDRINEFFEKHENCNNRGYDCFDISYDYDRVFYPDDEEEVFL